MRDGGEDTQSIDLLFTDARKALYAGDLEEAEMLVDEALGMLGISPDEFGPETPPEPSAEPGSQPSEESAAPAPPTPTPAEEKPKE